MSEATGRKWFELTGALNLSFGNKRPDQVVIEARKGVGQGPASRKVLAKMTGPDTPNAQNTSLPVDSSRSAVISSLS
jgi:hypothetical protein